MNRRTTEQMSRTTREQMNRRTVRAREDITVHVEARDKGERGKGEGGKGRARGSA